MWYGHRGEPIMENERANLLWDFNLQTDRIEAGKPSLTDTDKQNNRWMQDNRCGSARWHQGREKKEEKIETYRDLANWNKQTVEESWCCPHSHWCAWVYIKGPVGFWVLLLMKRRIPVCIWKWIEILKWCYKIIILNNIPFKIELRNVDRSYRDTYDRDNTSDQLEWLVFC